MYENVSETLNSFSRDPSKPTFSNSQHDAGVCCIAWHPLFPNIAATGSYDEHVRLWDERSMRAPITTVPCGGGVWRLRWESLTRLDGRDDGPRLAAACMHGGCRVMSLSADAQEMRVTQRFTAHESLAYGIDWLPSQSIRVIDADVVSCSFYDRALYCWPATR